MLARSDDTSTKRSEGTTLFLVPREQDGIEIRTIPKLGMKAFGSCDVFLDDVFVSDGDVLGEPDRAWYQLVATLNNERIILASLACGVLDGVLEDAVAYLKERTAFGKLIGSFQSLQHYIAEMTMWQRQAELVTYQAAWLQSQGKRCDTEALMAKTVASEYAVQAADLGIQMLGGMGYSLETDMQRYWRDARVWRIGPITGEMCRNLIAESHGLPRSF